MIGSLLGACSCACTGSGEKTGTKKRPRSGPPQLTAAATPVTRRLTETTTLEDVRLTAKTDINTLNDNGQTQLHEAAKEGHTEVAEALLKAGATVDPKNIFGKTPLVYAAESGHKNTVILLLKSGATLDTVDSFTKDQSDISLEEKATLLITQLKEAKKIVQQSILHDLIGDVIQHEHKKANPNEKANDMHAPPSYKRLICNLKTSAENRPTLKKTDSGSVSPGRHRDLLDILQRTLEIQPQK